MYKLVTCRTCGNSKIQNIGFARDSRSDTGWRGVCKACTRGTMDTPKGRAEWGCDVTQKPEPMLEAWVKAMGAKIKDGKVVGGKRFTDAKTRKVWRLK